MAWYDLRAFLTALEERDALQRVNVPVALEHELAAIADRISRRSDGGPALLFTKAGTAPLPVAMNLFGSRQRMALALGVTDLAELSGRMAACLAQDSELPPLLAMGPAPCQEVVIDPPDCGFLPVPTAWPGDGSPVHDGRFLTLAQVVTRERQGDRHNRGVYRVACFSGNELGIHWRPGSGGSRHHASWSRAGEPMPVAIVLGGDPVTTFCATLPLPEEMDELALAGFLRGEPVSVARCLTSDLLVPATAEIIIEGLVDPLATRPEGSCGNHTGYYAGGGQVPLVRVTAVTMRRDAILPATLVGPPPQENYWLALAGSRLLLPLLQQLAPEITDIALPREGIYHGAAMVAIRKDRAGQGREVLDRIWKSGWLGSARLLVIVDHDLAADDYGQVYWRALNHCVWGRDLVLADPGNPTLPAGGRLGIDATRKLPGEAGGEAWPKPLAWPDEVQELITRRWREYGFTE